MKNILFITWDSPQTSYMEGLFIPIFAQIQEQSNYRFHIIQFTWGTNRRISVTQQKAQEVNIKYTSRKIFRRLNVTLGSLFTIYNSISFLKKYINEHDIDVVMPRSIMPTILVNKIKINCKILFDADGLPIEERLDFAGLKKTNAVYKYFKKEEKAMLCKADAVITRSKRAIDFHLNTIGEDYSNKFFVVVNGRDINFFNPNSDNNKQIRASLDLRADTKVFIYCGSLGPQYCWDLMLKIFKRYLQINHNSVFLVITANVDYTQKRIPSYLQNHIIVKSCPFEEIPKYLSIGDVAFALREPKTSMQGVAPIKLAEYLLMGIPTVTSSGIGDTAAILEGNKNCFIYNHTQSDGIDKSLSFIAGSDILDKNEIRRLGIQHFSIESSVSSYLKALNSCL